MQTALETIIHDLLEREEGQRLSPKLIWNAKLEEDINRLPIAEQTNQTSAVALMAGLHLMNDSLHASHSYAQLIEDDSSGAYWHGLMHRMEQDFSNSKYWFRNAGNHPVKDEMREAAAKLLQIALESIPEQERDHVIIRKLIRFRDDIGWNANDFVDLVAMQEHDDGTESTGALLEQLQWLELKLLLRDTYERYSSEQ
ncbi:hypothetical protein [Paenibacillus sp. HB172176]|uniref:hypothetical protein n=1 Tax=Paenibacillus sp. HB172176 TaxID=2493690 RepID=UPI00143CB69F|nr:hypothetical protein [Paenibacillus sp. HB172176]